MYIYIIVDLAKCVDLTLVGEIRRYGNVRYDDDDDLWPTDITVMVDWS